MRAQIQKPNHAQQSVSPGIARSGTAAPGANNLVHSLPYLRHTTGNQAENWPLQAEPHDPGLRSNTLGVTRLINDFNRIPVHGKPPMNVRAKLPASSAEDGYEEGFRYAQSNRSVGHCADRALDLATTQPGRRPTSPDSLDALREHYAQGEHAKAISAIHSGKGDGLPLPPSLRATMRAHLGGDFGDVRIHTDSFAERAAEAIRANAFTVQRNVFFGRGMFAPERPDGLFRLAHELTHTLQQRGSVSPDAKASDALEEEAERAVLVGPRRRSALSAVGPVILREPTYPRRATGNQMIREVERVLTLERDTSSSDELTQMWSSVASNFSAPVTAGSIARRIWTYLFLRHFVEPESRPGVESAHPRYLYSQTYGWLDMQHFFGFIDFAEQQFNMTGSRQKTLDAATTQGLDLETRQQAVRDYIVAGASPSYGPERLMQVRPPITPAFQAPRAAAGGVATSAATAVGLLGALRGTQREVFSQLDSRQRQTFYTDSAKSAFTYEDFQSNQLGTRFFLRHGAEINAQPVESRETVFRTKLASFFAEIDVENNQARLDLQAQLYGLPGQERFLAPKTTEAAVRSRHPELFTLPS